MFETPMTVVGRIVTDLRRRVVGDQELISFRVASNARRRTTEGNWEPGSSLFITVNCWGRLVTGVGAALYKGAPIIATGHVWTREYEDGHGNKKSTLEMRATSIGPDLSRLIVRIEQRPHPSAVEQSAVEQPAVEHPAVEHPAVDAAPAQEPTSQVSPELPLSA